MQQIKKNTLYWGDVLNDRNMERYKTGMRWYRWGKLKRIIFAIINCLGCNKQEDTDYKPVMRCKNFIQGIENWQEKLREELKKNGNKQ